MLATSLGQGFVFALHDVGYHAFDCLILERSLKCAHFIQSNAKTPHIVLEIIRSIGHHFRRKVKRSAQKRLCSWLSGIQHSRNTKVSYFEYFFLRNENIFRFQISVNDSFIMNMLHSQTYLRKQIENLILLPVLHPSSFLAFLQRLRYLSSQISLMSIIHNNTQFIIIGDIHLSKPHNIGILEHFQDFGFSVRFSPGRFIFH